MLVCLDFNCKPRIPKAVKVKVTGGISSLIQSQQTLLFFFHFEQTKL